MTDTPDDITEDLPSEPQQDDAAASEAAAEAAKYGWKPKDQFTLAPDGWVDAEKFLTLPSTQLKIARDTQKEIRAELAETRARAERAERMSLSVAEKAREQERAKYEAEIAALRQQQRSAAEIGDVATFDALEQRRARMAPPTVEPPVDNTPPEVKQFMASNAWTQDPEAMQFAYDVIENTPGAKALPAARQLAFADAKVREFFPDKFAPQAPRGPAKVDGGGLGGISVKQTYAARLPADVAKAGRDFVKQGIFKDIEEYARDYFEGN